MQRASSTICTHKQSVKMGPDTTSNGGLLLYLPVLPRGNTSGAEQAAAVKRDADQGQQHRVLPHPSTAYDISPMVSRDASRFALPNGAEAAGANKATAGASRCPGLAVFCAWECRKGDVGDALPRVSAAGEAVGFARKPCARGGALLTRTVLQSQQSIRIVRNHKHAQRQLACEWMELRSGTPSAVSSRLDHRPTTHSRRLCQSQPRCPCPRVQRTRCGSASSASVAPLESQASNLRKKLCDRRCLDGL